MQIADWEKNIFVECPRCMKIIKLLMQEKGYNVEILPTKQENIPTKKEIKKHKSINLIEFEE